MVYMDDNDDGDNGDGMDSIVTPMMIDQGLDLNDVDMDVDEPTAGESSANSRSKRRVRGHTDSSNGVHRIPESHIKIALSLYKVQQNIYLLDFQRVEVKADYVITIAS